MKKIIVLLLIAFGVSASELVYCPSALQCTTTSCAFEANTDDWLPITRVSEPFLPGEYRVSYVSAPYHPQDGGYAICVFTHRQVYETVMLKARPDAGLVVFEDAQTHWRHEENWGECRPEPWEGCPMQAGLTSITNGTRIQ